MSRISLAVLRSSRTTTSVAQFQASSAGAHERALSWRTERCAPRRSSWSLVRRTSARRGSATSIGSRGDSADEAWRARFAEHRLDGLPDELARRRRSSRTRCTVEQVDAVTSRSHRLRDDLLKDCDRAGRRARCSAPMIWPDARSSACCGVSKASRPACSRAASDAGSCQGPAVHRQGSARCRSEALDLDFSPDAQHDRAAASMRVQIQSLDRTAPILSMNCPASPSDSFQDLLAGGTSQPRTPALIRSTATASGRPRRAIERVDQCDRIVQESFSRRSTRESPRRPLDVHLVRDNSSAAARRPAVRQGWLGKPRHATLRLALHRRHAKALADLEPRRDARFAELHDPRTLRRARTAPCASSTPTSRLIDNCERRLVVRSSRSQDRQRDPRHRSPAYPLPANQRITTLGAARQSEQGPCTLVGDSLAGP